MKAKKKGTNVTVSPKAHAAMLREARKLKKTLRQINNIRYNIPENE